MGEACQTVLTELRDLQEQRMARLEEAGIPPDQVRSWRQDLGEIEDVVLDQEGDLAYVLVGRGGFFVGQDLVPVRWQDLRAVPDLDTFVLNVDEEAFEQAPAVDRDVFADSDAYAQRRYEIDSYWQQNLQG